MDSGTDPIRFIHELEFDDLPAPVVDQARRCLIDLVGVAAAGSTTALSRMVRDHAAGYLLSSPDGGRTARLWFDGRLVSPAGAALANAATIDSLDGHDGHRLTKGHAGVAVLPATFAVLDDRPDATGRDLLTALVVGYEIATRAGIALHATARDYHSSGAWNALGAAAVAARGLGLDTDATAHALGIAEYHGPRAPMMRCIDHPTMVKDSSGWGAHAGVSAALLAEAGFTGAPAELLRHPEWSDLGRRWTLTEQYLKPHPVCRWAQPAIEATTRVIGAHAVDLDTIRALEIHTFAAATRLAAGMPPDTEIAQYSLAFPVALAAVHGTVPAELVVAPEHADDRVRRLVDRIVVHESAAATAAFPAARTAEVTVVLDGDGGDRRLWSGPVSAPGEPEWPLSDDLLADKFVALAGTVVDQAGALLARLRDVHRLPLAEAMLFAQQP